MIVSTSKPDIDLDFLSEIAQKEAILQEDVERFFQLLSEQIIKDAQKLQEITPARLESYLKYFTMKNFEELKKFLDAFYGNIDVIYKKFAQEERKKTAKNTSKASIQLSDQEILVFNKLQSVLIFKILKRNPYLDQQKFLMECANIIKTKGAISLSKRLKRLYNKKMFRINFNLN